MKLLGCQQSQTASSLNSVCLQPQTADNTTLTVTKNGRVLFNKVLRQGNDGFVSASTDASTSMNRDSIIIYSPEGVTSVGSAQGVPQQFSLIAI